jgi:hypothetical protein
MKSLVAAMFAATCVWPTGLASADPQDSLTYDEFQTPSGNIDCGIGSMNSKAFADCEIRQYTWTPPPRPQRCEGAFGDRIALDQGTLPAFVCHSDTLKNDGLPTLDVGQSRSAGPITCVSETFAVTCTDSGTGNLFTVSADDYKLS